MSVVRVGIIGFGRIGAEHAGWLERGAGIRAAAVADVTSARREMAGRRGLVARERLEELLVDPDIDAILVSTPTSMHFDQASAALDAGKHVMIEKPIATNLQQARELVNLAARRKRVLSVFHNRRWDADFLAVKSAIESGVFGRIINIESRLGQWGSCVGPAAKEYHPNWRNESAFGGGALFDWGSHFVDQIWQLMVPAKPIRVFAQLRRNVWSGDCDDFARVCIDFDNDTRGGAVGLVEINTTTTLPLPRWHIDGTAGSGHSPYSLEFDVSRWAEIEFKPASGADARCLPAADAGLTEIQIWNRFAEAIAGRDEPAVTLESVLPTMALLDAARESSRRGRAVAVSI
jgi:scyllo-inositol 2-dehydrogenase (NADP+)